jgi:hypothetical protein
MIDKNEQRARAAKISADLAAKGLVAPKLDWPTPKKVIAPPGSILSPVSKNFADVYDIMKHPIEIGDTVVYTYYNTGALRTGKVIGFSKSKKSALIRGSRYGGTGSANLSEFYKPVGNVAVVI